MVAIPQPSECECIQLVSSEPGTRSEHGLIHHSDVLRRPRWREAVVRTSLKLAVHSEALALSRMANSGSLCRVWPCDTHNDKYRIEFIERRRFDVFEGPHLERSFTNLFFICQLLIIRASVSLPRGGAELVPNLPAGRGRTSPRFDVGHNPDAESSANSGKTSWRLKPLL